MAEILAFLKPDAILRPNVGAKIVYEIASHPDFSIQSLEIRQIDESLASTHYSHLKQRPFFGWLMSYVTFSPAYVMLIACRDEMVTGLRTFLGNTMSHLAQPGTIRGSFGIYGGVNCLHASDSVESGCLEASLWKERLGLQEGRFDQPISEFMARYDASTPNNTMQLRELCADIAKSGDVTDSIVDQIHELLRQECPGSSETTVQDLASIILGSCTR